MKHMVQADKLSWHGRLRFPKFQNIHQIVVRSRQVNRVLIVDI